MMKNYKKYEKNYFMPPKQYLKWAKKDSIDKAPIWCSVDLRDGNQALVVPMDLETKISFFKLLVEIGFKEIEVGFPAASKTEYDFLRALIDRNLIPDDVTVQVLTQARPHIIKKTFEALNGINKAIVHFYNSTSVAQREQVFKKSKKEIIKIAADGAKLIKKYAHEYKGNYRFEYSPESFTGTEMEFALDICNQVLEILEPSKNNKVIINLPVTVSMSMSHIYASQIEYICENIKQRENVIISIHPHNDRGCAVADAELALLAGADRVEGTLFGNGERTGNVDIVTLAMNMFSHGIDPKLDFSDMPRITETYEKMTDMHVYERQPYCGKLVFAAFSGSHQDAIAKGMKYRRENKCSKWTVPYLPIDPKDIGREYDGDVIRINSQSGKGGIGYLMEQKFGIDMPPKMREMFGYMIKNISDKKHKELLPDEIIEIFRKQIVNIESPVKLIDYKFKGVDDCSVYITILDRNKTKIFAGTGNGRLDAVNDALQNGLGISYSNLVYKEHALERGSKSQAIAYVGIDDNTGVQHWGAATDNDIMTASIKALICAINRMYN